jgi:hypothetical protein
MKLHHGLGSGASVHISLLVTRDASFSTIGDSNKSHCPRLLRIVPSILWFTLLLFLFLVVNGRILIAVAYMFAIAKVDLPHMDCIAI